MAVAEWLDSVETGTVSEGEEEEESAELEVQGSASSSSDPPPSNSGSRLDVMREHVRRGGNSGPVRSKHRAPRK